MLSKREGLMLYWCEGDKTLKACMASLTCAEPLMLCYFVDWLVDYYGANRNRIRLRLHLREGADEEEAVQFWSDALKIPKQAFQKTWFKTRSGSRKKYQFGICRAAYYSKPILLQILKDIEREFKS
jgi:hypothetical protein